MSGRTPKKPSKRKGGRAWYEAAWLTGLLLVACALYLGLALSGGTGPWWILATGGEVDSLVRPGNPGGPVGGVLSLGLHAVFGSLWCWLVPVVLGVLGIVLTAGYILWMVQRVFYGPVLEQYKGVADANALERGYTFVFIAIIMLVGIYPAILTDVIKIGILPIAGLSGG